MSIITAEEDEVSPVPAPGKMLSVDPSEVTPISAKTIAVDPSEVSPVPNADPRSDPAFGSDEWYQQKIGGLVPQAAVPVLTWLQQHVNDPLDKVGAKLQAAGREAGSDVVSSGTLMQHADDYLNATVPSPYGPKPPVQSPDNLAAEQHPVAKGVAEGVGGAVGGALDPRYLPLFAMGGSEVSPILQRLLSTGFAAQLGKGSYETVKSLHDNWDNLTPEQRAEMATQGGVSAAMATAAGLHALGGEATGNETPIKGPFSVDESDVSPAADTSGAPISADESEVSPVTPGPGAQNLGTGVKESGSDITQLGASLKLGAAPNVADRVKAALGDVRAAATPDAIKGAITDKVDSVTDAITSRLARVKAAGSALWDSYSQPAEWTDFKDSRGKWDYALQRSSHEAMQFAKDIKAGIPDPLTREAFVNYIQAGGDDVVLQQRSEASDGDLKKGYDAARNLTDDQKIQAQNISNYFEAKLQQAQDAGMLKAGIDNYVNQVWDRPNPVTQKLQADVDYGTLNTNPSLLKKRVFDSYFDGEQAGFKPRNKDIGYLVTAYDEAFNKATAGRAFVKSVLDGKGKDGRPLLVANGDRAVTVNPETPASLVTDKTGKPIISASGGPAATMISPKFIGEKYADYKPIDHPALQKWTWIGKDSDGKPIYQKGDLWVHPDAYKDLNNNLSNSKLRQIPTVKSLMDVSQKIKGSMLGYSLFHQVQEGVHAVGHGVNPFNVGKIIDFEAPDQKTLIEHGLQVSNARAQQEFMDGHDGAYAYKVPLIGRMAQQYSDYLFHDYIPNLKMKTALDILERNKDRFAPDGKPSRYTAHQIAEISANQANAAYGELNYRQMGRNKTLQDVFRVLSLAPDFTEARGRFIAQALRPEGAEQRAALMRLTVAMYGAARVANMALNGGNPRLDKPFSVTYHGKDYFLRGVVGDAAHLVMDRRSFLYNRLNPVTTKPLIQYLTGVDEFGRKRTASKLFTDTLKGWTPIAVQKWIKNPQDFSPLDALLQSMGIASSKATPSDKALRQQFIAETLPMHRLRQMQSNGDLSDDQVRRISAPARSHSTSATPAQ